MCESPMWGSLLYKGELSPLLLSWGIPGGESKVNIQNVCSLGIPGGESLVNIQNVQLTKTRADCQIALLPFLVLPSVVVSQEKKHIFEGVNIPSHHLHAQY